MAKGDSLDKLVNSAKRNKSTIIIFVGFILVYVGLAKSIAYLKYGRTRRSILNEMNEIWKVKRIEELEKWLDNGRIERSIGKSDTWRAANPWTTKAQSVYSLLTAAEKNALGRQWYIDYYLAANWNVNLDADPWGNIAFEQICEEMNLSSNDILIKTLKDRVGDSFSFVV